MNYEIFMGIRNANILDSFEYVWNIYDLKSIMSWSVLLIRTFPYAYIVAIVKLFPNKKKNSVPSLLLISIEMSGMRFWNSISTYSGPIWNVSPFF